MKGLVIAAAQSGAGKSTITLGLLRALRDRGVLAVGAKSGPDYIDPGFHAAASGAPSVNLDAWAMTIDRLRAVVDRQPGELVLVEGAMGLFDGAPDGRGSTADVAAALSAPVVLVLDVAAQAQTVAAIATGLARWRSDIRVVGVILNRIGSARHTAMLRDSLAETDLPVIGAVPRDAGLSSPSRHLGLVQVEDRTDLSAFVAAAGDAMATHIDLDTLIELATPLAAPRTAPKALPPLGQRIAVAKDAAFSFLYPHQIADWRAAGVEITFFSPLYNEAPRADADAIFLPGGYPELHAGRLADADLFRGGLQTAAANGTLIYGECGGYMALGDGLVDGDGARHPMTGLLRLETSFATRKMTLGYRHLRPIDGGPWTSDLRGHEFHYSSSLQEQGAPLFHAFDALGDIEQAIGLRNGSVMGSYAHIIDPDPS